MAKKSAAVFPVPVPKFKGPTPGSDLVQLFFSSSKLAADVASVIGQFNPHWVTTRRRMQMRNDPDVAFALMIQRAPIINMEWSVESEDPVIKAFVEVVLKKVYRQMATGLSNAIPLGRQLCEMVWESQPLTLTLSDEVAGTSREKALPQAWLPVQFKAIDPRSYNFLIDVEKDDWFGVEQIYQGRMPVVMSGVPREKLVLWSFRREDVFGRLEGWALCDQMYEGWWNKNALRFIRNRYMQKSADPPKKAKAGPEITIDGKKQNGFTYMANQALALEGGGVVVFPSAVDKDGNPLFDLEYLNSEKRGDMFQEAIEGEKLEILRGGLITDRAATSGHSSGGKQRGGLAESRQHAEVMAESQESFIDEFAEDVIQPQVIDRVVRWNFGEEALQNSKTRLVTSGISSSLQEAYTQFILGIMDAEKAQLNGEPIKLWERIDAPNILKALQIPLRPAAELEDLAQKREAEKKANEQLLAQGGGATKGGGPSLQDPELENAVRNKLVKAGVAKPPKSQGLDVHQALEVKRRIDQDLGEIRTELGQVKADLEFSKEKPAPVPPPAAPTTHVNVTIADGAVRNETTVENQPQPIEIKQGDTHHHHGDVKVDAQLHLKPGEKKTVVIKGPDGKESTATITPEEGTKAS